MAVDKHGAGSCKLLDLMSVRCDSETGAFTCRVILDMSVFEAPVPQVFGLYMKLESLFVYAVMEVQ